MTSNNLEDKKGMTTEFGNYKELIMYFQTSIRNVGLFTAVSFAAIANSRAYKDKNKVISVCMILISLLLLISSFLVNLFLYRDVEKYIGLDGYADIGKWTNVNYLFLIIHTISILFGIYMFYKKVSVN
jgi:CBS domain containing-hemolysin-like protein